MTAALTRRTVLLSTAALAACGAPSTPLAEAPFQDGHPHVVLPAIVQRRPCLAVLDNGAPTSGLDQAFAQAEGLADLSRGVMTVADQGFAAELLIDDLSEMAISTELPVNAIVGMDLFRQHAVGIDFGTQKISLFDRTGFAPPHGAKRQRVQMAARREPALMIAIDGGKPMPAVVDLGCSAPLLVSPAFAALHGIGKGRAVSTRQGVVSADGGLVTRASPLTSVERVKVAGREIRDVPVSIMPEEAGPFAPYDLIIGLPLLRCFDLWLALPEQIWMKPTPRTGAPLERRFTGIQTKPQDLGLLIRHVGRASPAEKAGLREGDFIVSIDGVAPTQQRLRTARAGEVLDIRLPGGRSVSLQAARYY